MTGGAATEGRGPWGTHDLTSLPNTQPICSAGSRNWDVRTGPLLDRLVESTEWLQLRAGERLFSEGDPADGMYILFDGRLRFAIESSPVAQAQFDVEPVAVFGEGALLTGGGRSRTAVVVIDALLARIPPHMFDEILRHSPDVAVEIARRIAMRTVFPTADTRRRDISGSRIALVSPSLPISRLEALRGRRPSS